MSGIAFEDRWLRPVVNDYVARLTRPFTVDEVLLYAVKVTPPVERRDQMRVASILRELGFGHRLRRVNGVRAQYWSKADHIWGKTYGESMNAQTFWDKFGSQSAIAKKVFEAVPIQSPQSITWITSALKRAGGTSDLKVVGGCLSTLKESGLVREPKAGTFQRDPVPGSREDPKVTHGEGESLPLTFLERMADLALGMRATGIRCAEIADKLEELAVEIEEGQKSDGDAAQKLRALQNALKGLV